MILSTRYTIALAKFFTAALLTLAVAVNPSHAQISVTGSVLPSSVSNPNWNVGGTLNIGRFANGALNVNSGGTVSNSTGTLGGLPGLTGSATVTGAGAQWNNSSNLIVGSLGIGNLNVNSGGVVTNVIGRVGDFGGSSGFATVNGPGSQWINSSFLLVGDTSSGTLDIEAGGFVSNAAGGIIGSDPGSMGIVTVTGAGSHWNNLSGLDVGRNGTGTLNIFNGGIVSVASTLNIGSNGTVNVQGGLLQVAEINFTAANASLSLAVGGTLDVGQFIGDLTQDGGILAPGDSPGTMTITGDYTLDDGILEIELAGTTPGTQHDVLEAQGAATLNGGALNVSFLDSFEDAILPSDTFTILTSGSALSGTFAGLPDGSTLGTVDGLGSFQISYNGNSVILSNYVAAIPEPGSVALLLAAMLCSVGVARRRLP